MLTPVVGTENITKVSELQSLTNRRQNENSAENVSFGTERSSAKSLFSSFTTTFPPF